MEKIHYNDWLNRVDMVLWCYAEECSESLYAYPWEAFYEQGLRPAVAANIALDGILEPILLRVEKELRRISE